MEKLVRGILEDYKQAVRQIDEAGQQIDQMNKECRVLSRAVGSATYSEYEKARLALHEAIERREIAEAGRDAIMETVHESAKKARKQVLDMLERQNETDPQKVDGTVMELLRNELFSDRELKREAGRFSDNPTMLRLIGKYAARRAGPEMQSLAADIENICGNGIIGPFDHLVKVCDEAVRRARAWRADRPSADEQIKALDASAGPIIEEILKPEKPASIKLNV